MEPLDPKLGRLVHDGMMQAVPDQALEDRVLIGLLARLPQGGPPEGDGAPAGDGPAPRVGEGMAATGKAGAAAGGKAWLWIAALGVTVVAGGLALGGRDEPSAVAEQEQARDRSTAATRTEPAARERTPEPPTMKDEPSAAPAPDRTPVAAEPRPAAVGVEAREPPSPSRRAASEAAVDRADPAPTSAPVPTPTTPAPASDELAVEIQQIAAADRALARGDSRRALELAREHALAHPHGQLAVERTAIEHAARCQLGEAGAVEAAATFLRTHADAPAAAKVRTRCAAPR